jgi:hypothetical protein
MVQHIIALSRTAVIVRHWFEIDLQDSSMEHGVRIELRQLIEQARRGSESAAQLITLDRPLWRADLFDRHTDPPGSFGVAHFHPQFLGNEPCQRAWDPLLKADPYRWLSDQFCQLGGPRGTDPWPVDSRDAAELSQLSDVVVSVAQQLGPDQCTSAKQCYELTRDVRDAVQVMLTEVQRPDLLDEDWLAPWRAAT